jgi:hypothetical protein
MFLSDIQFQQTSDLIRERYTALSLNCRHPSSVAITPVCRHNSSLLSVFYSYLITFFPWRNNSPSTAAAPPFAAAITPVSCGKSAFFSFLPQLSSPLPQQKSNPFTDSLLSLR